jgi:hypothetical protein
MGKKPVTNIKFLPLKFSWPLRDVQVYRGHETDEKARNSHAAISFAVDLWGAVQMGKHIAVSDKCMH